MITHLDLMLAGSPGMPAEQWIGLHERDDTWAYSEKVDGIRCLSVEGRLITRNGFDVTEHFPEIEVPQDWILDTEIAVVDARGRADFEAVNRRAKGGHGGDAAMFVFDALAHRGQDLRNQSYHYRWLEAFGQVQGLYGVHVLPLSTDGVRAWNEVVARDGEGLVARTARGVYVRGRTSAMVKLKRLDTLDVIVTGRTPGTGGRAATFGALELSLVDHGAPAGFRRVGEVGSGFSAAEIVEVLDLLAAGRPFVVEVQHMGWTSGGRLRHPVFHRVRPDVDVLSCVVP